MTRPRIGSLFTGYGGLDMAVEAITGGHTVWRSDIDPGANKIIAHHWPDQPNLGDISAVDWATVEPIDVLTGGFPCQDVSAAGKRAGLVRYGEGNRSGLWAEMARAIDILRPSLVVAENVRGLLSAKADAHPDVFDCLACVAHTNDQPMRALGAVLGDLAVIGYDAAWHGVEAADAGAPHRRFRVFIVAWPADTNGTGVAQRSRVNRDDATELAPPVGGDRDGFGAMTLLKTPTAQLAVNGGTQHPDKRKDGGHGPTLADEIEHLLPTPTATPYGSNRSASAGAAVRPSLEGIDFGQYTPAIRRWENLTRPAPAPTETGTRGGQRLSPRFVEWMMGLPDGHVTAPAIGLTRNEQLKALGNGVVPQQATAALDYLLSAVAA